MWTLSYSLQEILQKRVSTYLLCCLLWRYRYTWYLCCEKKRIVPPWRENPLSKHWQRASDCLIWRNLSHKNKNMMAGHFSHLLLPALFPLCLQKWGNFSGYMPYSLAALDETSSLDSHNGTKTFLKLHFNSHTPLISQYIFHIVCQ